jgi:MFS family permease
MCLQALSGIAAAHMKDVGLEPDFVARMVSLQALVMACTKFLTGVSYDKFGMRVTMTICDVAAVIATVLLTLTNATATGMALAAAFAVMVALALPLETIMLSLFAAELFGNRAFPKTMGIFAAVNTAGYAVGNPIANWVFDTFGSYNPIILTFGAIMLAVTIVFQFILSAAYKDRKIILAAVEEKTV